MLHRIRDAMQRMRNARPGLICQTLAAGGLPTDIPTGVGAGASGTIHFSSDIENAISKVTRK
jgi:hypothetical protein